MKKLMLKVFVFAVALTALPQTVSANGFSCDPWQGLYNTGGYNLYSTGYDLYNLSTQYGGSIYGGSNYGGGCGSFYGTCQSPYGSAGLYGNNFGINPQYYNDPFSSAYSLATLGLNVVINLNLFSDPYSYGYGGSSCSSCSSCGSSYNMNSYSSCGGSNYYDVGCGVGYCGSQSYFPYNTNTYGGSPYYGNQTYTPQYNNMTFNYNPYTNGTYPTPANPTPIGSCGGVVGCSGGTPTRPIPPTYQTVTDTIGTDPVRFQVPRGATH